MLIFKHTTFSLSGAQGEERWRSADGTVGLPTGAPARHPPMHRIAAAPAPTAPAPPLRVRVACLCARPLRSRASAHSPSAACVAHGHFTSNHVVCTQELAAASRTRSPVFGRAKRWCLACSIVRSVGAGDFAALWARWGGAGAPPVEE